MVYGTSTAPWLDCVRRSTRRQLALRGVSPAAIDEHLAGLDTRIATAGLNGRSAAYHRQLATVDLEAAWSRAKIDRVLALRGEHDWVVDLEEQQRIATLVGARAAVVDVAGLDHLMGWHPDRRASLERYGSGSATPALLDATLEWMLASGLR
jgi:hypothetical protein